MTQTQYIGIDFDNMLWDFFTLDSLKEYLKNYLDIETLTEEEIPSLLSQDYDLILQTYQ